MVYVPLGDKPFGEVYQIIPFNTTYLDTCRIDFSFFEYNITNGLSDEVLDELLFL